MSVVIKKEEPSKWEVLCDKKPGNLVVWWDLVEKYEEELGTNQEPQQETKKTKKVKKPKRRQTDQSE